MEFQILLFIQRSYLVEVLSVVTSVRFLWAQWLPVDLEIHRGSSLLFFFIFKYQLMQKALLRSIHFLSNATTMHLQNALRYDRERHELIFRYNILKSQKPLPVLFSIILCALIVIFKPVLIGSLLIADFTTMRIHQHILRSLT